MSKWILYIMLILPVLCFFMHGFTEKNTVSLIASTPGEIVNPGHGINVSVLKTISLEKAKNQSVDGYCIDRNASSRNLSIYESSNSSGSSSGQDTGSSSGNSVSGMDSKPFNTPEPTPIPEPTPTYTIQNVAIDVACRGFPKSGVLAAGDMIHYRINATLDDKINNGSGNIISSARVSYAQVSPQSSKMKTYKYTITQPVSPPRKYRYLNTSDLGESSHYVGANGHTITLVNNESAVDPTYKQLVEFIKEDKTNEIPYNNTSFVCSDAAESVHNNAEAIGFRCAWVYIDFINERATRNPVTNALVVGHACNLFNTTDRGLVAIDCTGGSYPTYAVASIDLSVWDDEVSLVKNGEYIPRLLYSFPGSDKLKAFLSVGTIADFNVFW